MNSKNILLGVLLLGAATLASCDGRRVEEGKNIVINELMPSNRTGMLNDKGKAADWIELKNTSDKSISLKGFQLEVERAMPDSATLAQNEAKKKTDKSSRTDEADETDTGNDEKPGKDLVTKWRFPDVTIGPGETMLLFAAKKNDGDEQQQGKTLTATLKFPKEGATVRFLSPGGTVIQEVTYDRLNPDQALARQDTTYLPTYWQSPGFENTRKGYEEAHLLMADQRKSPLLIWELMSRAQNSYENWVELKNVSNQDVQLSDYALSKKLSKKGGWQLPARILKPGEIISITLSGSKRATGELQAPFKLGGNETLVLSKGGKFVDGVCAKSTKRGGSIGRANGKKGFFFYPVPTRNAENGDAGRRFVAETPAFTLKPGVYGKEKRLELHLANPNQKVHYTLNGSEPNASSPLLKAPLVLTETTVVRMFAEGDDSNLSSNIATDTYMLGVNHTVPVVNITVNNADLYDFNTGIFANGPGYTPQWPHKGANYFKDWTKNAHVEIFDTIGGVSADCGLKVFGGFSRCEEKKSLRLKFRGVHGQTDLYYDFFGTGQPIELKDLVLRSGSQDYNRCMIRDEFFTSLLQKNSPTILTQAYRPVALYINGKYFGLYYLREKINKDFVARHLNIPNDSIDIIFSNGTVEEGTRAEYTKLMQYVTTHDMKEKANYDYIKNLVDIQGLIDHKLGEIYTGNTDVGNVRYARSSHQKSDKKWHFIFFDLDATWVGYKPSANYYLSTAGNAPYVADQNILIHRLLANKEFRAQFLERLAYHLENTFSEKNATEVFNRLVEQIRPEMKLNCQRWPQLSYQTWEKNLNDFKAKFKEKPKVMLNDIRALLNVTAEENKKYFSKLGY